MRTLQLYDGFVQLECQDGLLQLSKECFQDDHRHHHIVELLKVHDLALVEFLLHLLQGSSVG